MKSDINTKRKRAKKVSYKESWEDSEEDQSIQDIESKRVMKGKLRKNKAISSYESDDEDFDPKAEDDFEMLDKEDAEDDESLSMQIDEMSLDTNGKAKKPKAKRTAKPKKKNANEENLDEISLDSQANKNAEKPKRAKKAKKEDGNDDKEIIKENKNGKNKKSKSVNNDNTQEVSKDSLNKVNKKEKKEKKEKIPKDALDLTYDIEKNYFYQELTKEDLNKIQEFFECYFANSKGFDANKEAFEVKAFLDCYPNLRKGISNVEKLKKM